MALKKRLLFMFIPGGLSIVLLIVTVLLSLETGAAPKDEHIALKQPSPVLPAVVEGTPESSSEAAPVVQEAPKLAAPQPGLKPSVSAKTAEEVSGPLAPVLSGSSPAVRNSQEELLEAIYDDHFKLFRGRVTYFKDQDQGRPTPQRVIRPIFYKRDLSERIMASLFAGPSMRNLEKGLYSFIPSGLRYTVERQASTLVINLIGLSPEVLVGPLGGYVVYQILDTAFSHPDIRLVDLKIEGVSIRYPTPDGGERKAPFDASILTAFRF